MSLKVPIKIDKPTARKIKAELESVMSGIIDQINKEKELTLRTSEVDGFSHGANFMLGKLKKEIDKYLCELVNEE